MTNLLTKVQYTNAIEKGMHELAELKGKKATSIGRLLGVGTDSIFYEIANIAVKQMTTKKIDKYSVEDYEVTLRVVALKILKAERGE